MQYPSDWIKNEENLTNNAIVVFHPSNETTTAGVEIRVIPMGSEDKNKTFDELANITITQTKSDTSFQVINYSKITVGGKPALKMILYNFGQRNLFSNILGTSPQTQKEMMYVIM